MKTTLLAFGLAALALHASAAGFTRDTSFASVAAFVTAAKTFQPAITESDLASLFIVREAGDDPQLVTALTIKSSMALWSNDTQALVFMTAAPPTTHTQSCVGVLFLLTQERGAWRIADTARFVATGKYAEVSAELTAGVGTGYHLGSEKMDPVVTIKESHGGRGYAYQSSASYAPDATKLNRLELE